jgi:CzcA family heavy metal efflux pump
MVRAIIRSSLRFKFLVTALAAGVLVLGITSLRDAPVDVTPEFTPPYVEIQTEALGLSAQEVEQLITVPMEADLLNGVQDVEVLRSESLPGMSSITMVFDEEADLYTSRQLVQERLAQTGAAALPNVSKPPVMLQPYSSSSRLMMFGLSSDKITPIEKSVIARWTLQPRLLGVPGVANVSIWGFRDRQLQVQVDPERLRDRNVTLSQVVDTTGNAQISTPLSHLEGSTPGTGGFIETPQQRLGVRHVFDELTNPEELAKVPVEETGGRMQLGDVANVVEDHQPLIGDAVVNDADGLLLVVEKFPGANTVEVTKGVEAALEDLKPGLGGMEPDTSIFRPASFIETATDNLTLAIIIACALAAAALAAFLLQWRTVLICLFTIPLAIVAAALVLEQFGETFNAISVAGLAVALAVVIDDAVTGAQNVARRLREQRLAGRDTPTADIVREASAEVRGPLTLASLIALLPIVPVAFMAGRPGAFFGPLVLAYVLAVAAAMLIALTVTPALSLLLFSRGGAPRSESPIVGAIAPRYAGALARATRRPRAVLIIAGVAAVLAIAVLPTFGTSLIPSFKDTDVLVSLDAEPGTSNTRMTQVATQVSRELRSIDGVDNVGAHVGRAITGDQRVDVNSGEVWVSIADDADHDATMASIEDAVADVRGVRSDVVTYSEQKIRDVGALKAGENPVTGDGADVLTGAGRPLVTRVYGEDLDVARTEAAKVQQLMSRVDGVVDPRVEQAVEQPGIEIEVDLDRARGFGIKPGDVRRAEATLIQGLIVGSIFEQQKVFEVIVQGTPATRRNAESIRNLLLDRPGGGHVRLGQVADVREVTGPIAIKRESVSRYVDVTADVSGRSLGDVASDIRGRLQDSTFPLEYHAEVLEQTTSEEIDGGQILAIAIASIIAVFLLLQAAFRSWRLAGLAFLTLPVSLVGGVIAALIAGGDLLLGSLLGFLALFGLAARHGVILIRRFQDLERYEGQVFGETLVGRGAVDRLAPALTSTVALALVALVFVVLGSRAGLEVVHPMAVVLLGGLVTTSLVSMFVLPTLYLRYGGGQGAVSAEEEELMRRWVGVEPVPAGAGAEGGVAPVPGNGGVSPPSQPQMSGARTTDGGGEPGGRS